MTQPKNQLARSDSFSAGAAPNTLNALVWPTWKLNIELPNVEGGFGGKAIFTGSEPWDDAPGAGRDVGAGDALVRSGDVTRFTWGVTAGAEEPLADSFASAVLEQTILLGDGAVANFASIPVSCNGLNPQTEIRAYVGEEDRVGTAIDARALPPVGTTHVTLSCNLGEIGADASGSILLDTSIWASPNSRNGSEFTSTARVFGVNAEGVATAQPNTTEEVGPFEITSAPRYDLAKHAPFSSGWTFQNFDGERVAGRRIYYPVTISTDRKEGIGAFEQPVTFTEDFWAEIPGSDGKPSGTVVEDLQYRILECRPAIGTGTGSIVSGKNTDPAKAATSVSDSGKCEFERQKNDNTSPYTVTLSGIDTSGTHYPSKTYGGKDLAGTYYLASYEMVIFVPLTEIDRTNGTMGDGVGEFLAFNQVTGFDPVDTTGVSNFGDEYEPGYCADREPGEPFQQCDLMENGDGSNNIAGPNRVAMSPGSWSKSFIDHFASWSHANSILPGSAGGRDGAATIQPGEVHQAQVLLSNSGAAWDSAALCDVFDNKTLKLAPLNQLTGMTEANANLYPDDLYAYVHDNSLGGNQASQQPNQENFRIEYGSFDFGDDTPNNGEFDATTNRFGGSWLNQSSARCSDDAVEWKSDPTEVEGGIDGVNAVRAVLDDASELLPGTGLYLMTAFEQRDTFNGGPLDEESIPAGTIAANFGQVSTDTLNPEWTYPSTNSEINNRYNPATTKGNGGDRWTVVRATAGLDQRTISIDGLGSGAADFGTAGTASGGDPVIWEIVAAIAANSQTPAPVRNVVITQVLPPHVSYNAEMTAQITGGTPATTVEINPDGTTTLTWLIGEVVPNAGIPSRIIYTDTDPFAPSGTGLVAKAEITADSIIPFSAHRDEHTVTLEQDGKLQRLKSVDATLDLQNDTQIYSLKVKNFSDNIPIRPVTIIEVLPHNGDGRNSAEVNRTPASDFSGTSQLQNKVTATFFDGTPFDGTTYYTSVDPEDVPQDLNDDDADLWFTEAEFGEPNAPANLAAVTAFKFVASENLAAGSNPDKSGLTLSFETAQSDNSAGDLYANRFTAFSDTFKSEQGVFQLLTSNQTTVRIVGFSLGDLIWIDEDGDGKFDASADTVAPEGVNVEVYDEDDNLVGTATTNEDGRWILNDLAEGDYYAVIPAVEFAAGGKLEGYAASTVNAVDDPNADDANENVDHHAVQDGTAVRTAGLMTLSATTVETVDGTKITGDEPLGDNVGSLRPSPLTTDDFTNFTLDMALEPVPGYEFTKTSDPVSGTAVAPGDEITYTLTGVNTGKTVLDPVVITDDLSGVLDNATLTAEPVVTIDGAAAATDAEITDTTLSWSGALQVGETVSITYTVTLNDDVTGVVVTNTAWSSATPPGEEPITPPEVTREHPVPGYVFAKSSDPVSGTAVMPGEKITYTVSGENTGDTILDPVTIADDLSGVLEHAELAGDPVATITGADGVTRDAGSVVVNGAALSWAGALGVGERVDIVYSVTLNDDAAGATLVNSAESEATPPGLPPITPPEVTTEHPVPGYEFAKSSDPVSGTPVKAGESITYTLTGINTGATVLDPVTITDDLSGVLEHAELAGDPVATITGADGVTRDAGSVVVNGAALSWAGALGIGERVDIVYSVTLNDDAAGATLVNSAESEATPPGLPPITPPEVTTEHPVPGYEFAKSSDPVSGTPVKAGEPITYTLTGINTGATILDPVTITDDLSGVLAHAELTGDAVVTITDAAGTPREAEAAELDGTTLAWTGSLAAGERVDIVYTVTLNDDAAGATLVNSAESEATPPGLPPITPPEVETHHPTPGFTFWKGSDPVSGTPVAVGESVTYTLNGANSGETVLDPVVITDDLSKVLAHATLNGDFSAVITDADGEARDAAAPVLNGTTLTWTGSLEIGEQVVVSYTVVVNEGAEGATLTNTANAEGTPPGLPPLTPPSAETEHPVPGYELAKTSDPDDGARVKGGDTINYVVTGTNTGASVLDPVVVTDDLSGVLPHAALLGDPVAVVIDAAGEESFAAAPVLSGTTLEWVGSLNVGERVELRYSVTVNEDAVGVTIENTATSNATPPRGSELVPPPVTTTHETPKAGLGVTGTNVGLLAGAGALTLLLGGALVLRARRKTAR